MKISQKIISKLKEGGADFFLSVPCKLLANMIIVVLKVTPAQWLFLKLVFERRRDKSNLMAAVTMTVQR